MKQNNPDIITNEQDDQLLDLTNIDEARKAFIASEILNRKY
jgi:hypothetical protein